MYKPNTNAVTGIGSSIPCQQSPWCCRLFKTLEIRASVIKDVKSRHAITTACKLFALSVSTLLVKCSSATCKVLVIAVCFSNDLSRTVITAAHTSNQEAADKQAWLLLPTWASILHACLPHTFMHDSPIDIHVFVHSSDLAGNAGAHWSLAHRAMLNTDS